MVLSIHGEKSLTRLMNEALATGDSLLHQW